MESFTYSLCTKDKIPIAVSCLCKDGKTTECIERLNSLKEYDFGEYKSEYTIDYRLHTIIEKCMSDIKKDIICIGASVGIDDAEGRTGGIFGSCNGGASSATESVFFENGMVFGVKPGKGAFAIEEEKEKAENIINFFADEFDGSYEKSITFYNKLCENGNIFILMTDGSGEGSYGIAADRKNIVTVAETAYKGIERTDYKGFKRIGIMGGTFDPIHNGHLIAAQTVCDKLKLDIVVFMPTGNTSYKNKKFVTSGDMRFAMTSIATESNEKFYTSSMETEFDGISYTSDTMEKFRRFCDDDAEIYFIVGADVLKDMTCWRNFRKLISLCGFAAVTRPGYPSVDRNKYTELFENDGSEIKFIEVPALDISSSYIRKAVKDGLSVKYLLPDSVEEYIKVHHLYEDNKKARNESELDRILNLIN